jgi:glucokinase
MKEVVLGIDIGGTFTKFGIVDRLGNCLEENFTNTNTYFEFDAYLENLHSEIGEMMVHLQEDAQQEIELKGIGIGAPNGNYYRGTIEHAPNLNWKGEIQVTERFKKYFSNVPVVLTNDANAAALGEMIYGGAKDMKDFIVITLGTGLGSGIVVNGQLVYGYDGFAGELGHVNVKLRGRQCGCGGRGCLETYASATGLKRTVFRLMADTITDSELRNFNYNELTAKMISEAARKGDAIAQEAFEFTGRILGSKLADAVAHTSPEAIFLLGGLAQAKELIIEPTRKSMEESLLPIFRDKVKVQLSALQDTNAAVLGASALAWKELED